MFCLIKSLRINTTHIVSNTVNKHILNPKNTLILLEALTQVIPRLTKVMSAQITHKDIIRARNEYNIFFVIILIYE
jgi:hypothetical protein